MIAGVNSIPDVFNQAQFLVDRHIEEGRAGNIVVYYEDDKITYAELAAMVNRTGNVLRDLGVEMENRVMILMPDRPEVLYTHLGAMKIGAVSIPVNTLMSPQDYKSLLNDSRAKVLVVSSELVPKVQTVRNELEHLRHMVVVGQASNGTLSYDKLITGASDRLEAAQTSKDDMAFWMYTSGTTGLPKGVVHLHHDLIHYMYPFSEQVLGMTDRDVVFCTSKVFFSYGRNNSLEIPLLFGGTTVLNSQWPDAAKVFQIIERYRPSLFFSVPTFYAALLREAEKTPLLHDLSSIRICVSSGEPLPKDIYERWLAKFGLQILDVMGSTDVGGQYLSNRLGEVRPGSSGKLLHGFEGILKDAKGKQVPQCQVGTLWLRNDGIADRYWNKHQRSKEVFQGQWFNTGDLFYKDADGYYWYQGREDDMLKVSGQWISPIEIEEALQKHRSVCECGVVSALDESGLARVKAFVKLDEGYQASSKMEEELIDFVHDRVAHFKTPRWIQFVEKLPRTTTGKLQRYRLRQGLA